MSKVDGEKFDSVWDAIADTRQEVVNLRMRSELMDQISSIIATKGWSCVEVADRSGLTESRINDLLRGRISRFSLDALVNLAAALGFFVHVKLEAT